MRKPQNPPNYYQLFSEVIKKDPVRLEKIFEAISLFSFPTEAYPHWDKLRFLPKPEGFSHQEWWLGLKMERLSKRKEIPLKDTKGRPFYYSVVDPLPERLHEIDLSMGGGIKMPEQITNPDTRDQYYVKSLIEEAITSSQLEGATTTRRVARQMIRAGRKPSDQSEKMIFNNYLTMKAIGDLKNQELSPELVFKLHRLITLDTLEDADTAGRFRTNNKEEIVVVGDDAGEVFHVPPNADELDERMASMCKFANETDGGDFIHPVLRAMILHFWLAYDHPFVDGNGRTARALFYWAMIRYGYWLSEFLSISTIILKGPSKYYTAFLHTETDDNDLNYFLIYHAKVLHRATTALQAYIKRQAQRVKELEAQMSNLTILNHRQRALISHAMRHPKARYTIRGHERSHKIAYQTARIDLLDLSEKGLLKDEKIKKQRYFSPIAELEKVLSDL